ncbi:hypothetical protein CsatB_027958 [Cannabis sativa]
MLYLEDFAQQHNESFYSAWRRFKELGERCYPTFSSGCFTWLFYNGLDDETKSWVDYGAEVTGEPLLRRGHEAINLLNDMADFDYDWHWNPSLQGWSHQYPPYCPNSPQPIEEEEDILSLPKEINRLADMVKALCDNLMAQDSESFKDNNSNNESYESCLNIVEAPSDEYIEETEPRIEEKESFEVVENLDTLDACSTNDELNLVNEETSILNDEIIEDQITVKDVDGHEETEQPIERLFEKSKKEVPLVVEESLVVVDLRLSTPLYYEPPMDPYFPLMPHSPYCILFELPKASPQAHHPKSYVVGADFCSNSSLSKLEGEYNNNFQVVLHDAYYGRQPLVDVVRR